MAGASTSLEALVAEMLGDVGKLHDQLERLKQDVPDLVDAFSSRFQGDYEQAARDLSSRAVELSARIEESTSQAIRDAAVFVANESTAAAHSAVTEIQGESEEASRSAAKLLEDVASAHKNMHAARWVTLAGGVCVAIFCLAFSFGYWMSSTANESREVKANQILVGAEGQAAMRLAELGEAKNLLDCRVEGWTEKDGFCYGTPRGGKTLGWRIK